MYEILNSRFYVCISITTGYLISIPSLLWLNVLLVTAFTKLPEMIRYLRTALYTIHAKLWVIYFFLHVQREDSKNISIGSGGRPGAWAQVASGGASAHSAARSAECEEHSKLKRFSALPNHGARGSTDGKGRLLGPLR